MSTAQREIAHGKQLAASDPVHVWGWASPAGRVRATRRAQLIAAGGGLAPGVRALEVGCGTGLFTEMFARSGATVVAIDLSLDLLAQARSREVDPRRVQFVCGRLEDLAGSAQFDAIIGSSVLHHLELAPALARMRALLKPRGLLSFAEPNMLNPQVFFERQARFLPMFDYVSPDETAFVRWPFARMLAAHGFGEISMTPFDWLHPATPPALIGMVSGIGAALERLPVARELAGSLYIRARVR